MIGVIGALFFPALPGEGQVARAELCCHGYVLAGFGIKKWLALPGHHRRHRLG